MNMKPHSAILASLSLATLLSSLGTSIGNVALPALARAFGAPLPAVQWVVLAYLLGLSSLVVAAGRAGDVLGRKRLLQAGLGLFSASAGLGALAPSLPVLVGARALQGAGAAAIMALTIAAVRDALPGEATGRAMGLLGTVSATGTALGPPLGGALVGAWGWPSVFIVQALLGVAALAGVARFLPPDAADRSQPRFDHPGTLLLGASLTAYALALTPGAGARLPFLLLALGGALLFVHVERRSTAPLVELGLFRDRALAIGFASSMVATAVVMATLVVGPFYLSGALGLGAGRMGLTMAAGPVVAALAGWPAGRLVDRYGASACALAGLAGMALGACILSAAPPATAGGYAASLALLTTGYALFQAANNTAVMNGAAAGRRGLISGLLGLSRNLGLVNGAALMGAVFVHMAGTTAASAPAAFARGFQACFGLAAVLLVLAMAGLAAVAVRKSAYRRPA